MTREEAIVHIKDVICENNSIKPNIVVFEQEKKALYMAIKALEQEPYEDAVRRLIKDKINTLEDIASTANSEGRWVEDEKCCYTIKVLEELVADLEALSPVIPQSNTDVLDKIRTEINSPNRGTCDYFIVDRIEEIINKYEAE